MQAAKDGAKRVGRPPLQEGPTYGAKEGVAGPRDLAPPEMRQRKGVSPQGPRQVADPKGSRSQAASAGTGPPYGLNRPTQADSPRGVIPSAIRAGRPLAPRGAREDLRSTRGHKVTEGPATFQGNETLEAASPSRRSSNVAFAPFEAAHGFGRADGLIKGSLARIAPIALVLAGPRVGFIVDEGA